MAALELCQDPGLRLGRVGAVQPAGECDDGEVTLALDCHRHGRQSLVGWITGSWSTSCDSCRGGERSSGYRAKSWRNGCRSEEQTSELTSLMRISYAVFCLKQKNTN